MKYKIGILIPSTNRNIECNNFYETYFFKIFLKSFIKTRNNEHNYIIYLVIDNNDKIYSQEKEKKTIKDFITSHQNLDIIFITNDEIPKGWLTKMWNKAFEKAYDDGCDYFLQCGDDIEFLDKNWVNSSIFVLKLYNNEGVTGPIDIGRKHFLHSVTNNKNIIEKHTILTQSFVSRNHMESFGFYFPEEIKNWFCDNWITNIYKKQNKCYKISSRIINRGGKPRYIPEGIGKDIPRIQKLCNDLVKKYTRKISTKFDLYLY